MDEAGIKGVAMPGFEMPTDRNGQLWVHFAPHDQARYVSAVDVLEGRVTADRVAQRLVIIGTSAAGLLDLKTTPNDPAMPGVEIHAQVLESILSNAMLSQPNYAVGAELSVAFVMGVAIIWLAPILEPAPAAAVRRRVHRAAGRIVLVSVLREQQLLIDFTFPLLSSLLIYLTLVFTNFVKEQAQRRQIRSAFGQYLSPTLVEQLAQSPEKLVLGGEARDMTIMFSDVRGFTTISEIYKDDPQGLTSLMNSFLTPLTNAIIDRKGTIDKYMGDAIMAFWNAPLYDPTHELNACEAALDMLDRVERLNREREAGGQGQRLAIHSDQHRRRHQHRPMRRRQHGLRPALRLFGAGRQRQSRVASGRPVQILRASDHHRLEDRERRQGQIRAPRTRFHRGERQEGTRGGLCHRRPRRLANSGRFQRWRELNMNMLSRYRSRDWTGALAAIEQGLAADEENRFKTLYSIYSERIRTFQVKPPPDDWDGAYALDTK